MESSNYNATKKPGRAPLVADERTVPLSYKAAECHERKILEKVTALRSLGASTNKSHVIRTIVEYAIDDVEEIFKELGLLESGGSD